MTTPDVDSGVLSSAVPAPVAPSNKFVSAPVLTAGGTAPDGVAWAFNVTADGYGWAMITQVKDSLLIDIPSVKAGIFAMGAASCRKIQTPVNVSESNIVFQTSGTLQDSDTFTGVLTPVSSTTLGHV